MIRRLNDIMFTILTHAHLPSSFWVEALHTASYLHNILPTKLHRYHTPTSLLYHRIPSYAHLRVFGCLCYPNTSSTRPHKLAPRSTPCVFLGYPTNYRGYRCLNLETGKTTFSRHVIFDESHFPFNNLTASTPTHSFLDPSPILFTYPTTSVLTPIPPDRTSPTHHTHTPSPHAHQSSIPIHSTDTQSHPGFYIPHPMQTQSHAMPTIPQNTQPANSTNLGTQQNQLPPGHTQPTETNHNPPSSHPMQTRSRSGISKPRIPLSLHTETIPSMSPLPKSHLAALSDPNWKIAMSNEYKALLDNHTWDLVPRPTDAPIIRCMWLYKHKFNADGSLERHKARLVVNGKSQTVGVDCDETFSPVVKPTPLEPSLA